MGRKAADAGIKVCEFCGKDFARRRFSGRLEDLTRFRSRRFCREGCATSKREGEHVRPREASRRRYINAGLPLVCSSCGVTDQIHIHHLDGDPWNMAMDNMQPLCVSCHLRHHWETDRRTVLKP